MHHWLFTEQSGGRWSSLAKHKTNLCGHFATTRKNRFNAQPFLPSGIVDTAVTEYFIATSERTWKTNLISKPGYLTDSGIVFVSCFSRSYCKARWEGHRYWRQGVHFTKTYSAEKANCFRKRRCTLHPPWKEEYWRSQRWQCLLLFITIIFILPLHCRKQLRTENNFMGWIRS